MTVTGDPVASQPGEPVAGDGGASSAYFRRLDDGRYLPGRYAGGVWGARTISGRILGGLIGHALEQEQAEPGFRLARLTVDLFRAIPFAPLTVTTALARAGGRIRVADVHVRHDGTPVARAGAVFLRPSSNPPGEIWHAERDDWPAPEPGSRNPNLKEGDRADVRPMIPGTTLDTALGGTPSVQRRGSWLRELREVVEGTALTPLVRAVLVGDAAGPTTHSGTAGIQYINTDFTLTLVREPVGEFFGVLARDQYAVDGVSFGQATIHDAAGLLGACTSTALANPGKAKASRLPGHSGPR